MLLVLDGKTFDTIEEIENTLKLLEKDYYHFLRWFNSQTMSQHNRRKERAGCELRITEQFEIIHLFRTGKKQYRITAFVCSIHQYSVYLAYLVSLPPTSVQVTLGIS